MDAYITDNLQNQKEKKKETEKNAFYKLFRGNNKHKEKTKWVAEKNCEMGKKISLGFSNLAITI
jgi:hypothetical protein